MHSSCSSALCARSSHLFCCLTVTTCLPFLWSAWETSAGHRSQRPSSNSRPRKEESTRSGRWTQQRRAVGTRAVCRTEEPVTSSLLTRFPLTIRLALWILLTSHDFISFSGWTKLMSTTSNAKRLPDRLLQSLCWDNLIRETSPGSGTLIMTAEVMVSNFVSRDANAQFPRSWTSIPVPNSTFPE